MWSLFTALRVGVGLWVVVLFENSIVCHLMKQILLFEHEHEHGQTLNGFLVFVVCFCFVDFFVFCLFFCLFFWRV